METATDARSFRGLLDDPSRDRNHRLHDIHPAGPAVGYQRKALKIPACPPQVLGRLPWTDTWRSLRFDSATWNSAPESAGSNSTRERWNPGITRLRQADHAGPAGAHRPERPHPPQKPKHAGLSKAFEWPRRPNEPAGRIRSWKQRRRKHGGKRMEPALAQTQEPALKTPGSRPPSPSLLEGNSWAADDRPTTAFAWAPPTSPSWWSSLFIRSWSTTRPSTTHDGGAKPMPTSGTVDPHEIYTSRMYGRRQDGEPVPGRTARPGGRASWSRAKPTGGPGPGPRIGRRNNRHSGLGQPRP